MKIYLLTCIIATIFITGDAFKCYNGVYINEVINLSTAKQANCPSEICAKTNTHLTNGTTGTLYSCSDKIFEFNSQLRANELPFESVGIYLCNNIELCNNGQSISSSITILIFTSATLFFLFKNFN